MELPEQDLLEDDLLRRKRSVGEQHSDDASEDILSVGQFFYPGGFRNTASEKTDKEFTSLGEFLYPSDYEINKLNIDADDFDYSSNLFRETKDIDPGDKTSSTEDNLLGIQEIVSIHFRIF